jgi:protein-tyrosine phosphatase
MIDIHNHLLSHMDDGADDEAESLTMCRMAEKDGIQVIAATPHLVDGQCINYPEDIVIAVMTLNKRLRDEGLSVRVVPGMEVRVAANLLEDLEKRRIVSLNGGRYILVDYHPAHLPPGMIRLIKEVAKRGYGVILGHPEKNLPIQRNPHYVYQLLAELPPWDLIIQISADSLLGQAGTSALRTAKLLLQNNLGHVIATDSHSPRRRMPKLSDAQRVAARILGKERASQMVREIPLAILTGRKFPEPRHPTKPNVWWNR